MLTASKLRENLYQILDNALKTGTPVEVVHKGKVLRVVPEVSVSKLARLKRRKAYKRDVDQVLGIDWLKEWSQSRRIF